MPCRVGMTTNLEERKQHWKGEYPNLSGWEVIKGGLSYSAALKLESEHAKAHGCVSYPGGEDNGKSNWSVYKFNY